MNICAYVNVQWVKLYIYMCLDNPLNNVYKFIYTHSHICVHFTYVCKFLQLQVYKCLFWK